MPGVRPLDATWKSSKTFFVRAVHVCFVSHSTLLSCAVEIKLLNYLAVDFVLENLSGCAEEIHEAPRVTGIRTGYFPIMLQLCRPLDAR